MLEKSCSRAQPVNCKRQCTIGVASLHGNEEAMLPVASADIFGSNNKLFDSGAHSLIRQETADSLALKEKEISATITKVGGQEEINTKVYNVPISAIDDRRTYSVKAIGIPVISSESSIVDTASIMEQLSQSGKRIKMIDPIDLLFGIDHVQLHTDPTKQKDHNVARKSPLGRRNSSKEEIEKYDGPVHYISHH